MNRMQLLGLAAIVAGAMLVGAVTGGVLGTAHADMPQDQPNTPNVRICPSGSAEVWNDCIEKYRATFAAPADTEALDGEGTGGEAEAVTCSLVDGCTVNVVDEDGNTVKVMHITFSDLDEPSPEVE